MTHELESKIEALEAEIRIKDQVITRLNRQAIFAHLLPAYMHEEHHILSALSMELTGLFEECRAKGITKYSQRITQDFERLRELNEHLARFIRSSENRVSLNDCLQETTKVLVPLFSKSRVLLQTRMSKEGETFLVSEWAMRQVLTNILLNALESLQETDKKDRLVIIETVFDKAFAKIQISDNGHGIRTEFVEKIWQPGFTTKSHKVGIGLTIAKDIVKSLGGYISVSSNEGELTQFTVMIPLQQETAV